MKWADHHITETGAMILLDAIGWLLDEAFITNSLTSGFARLAVSNLIVLPRIIYGAGFEDIQNQCQVADVDGLGRGKGSPR